MLPHELDERIASLREWQTPGLRGRVSSAAPGRRSSAAAVDRPSEQIVVDQELAAAGAPELVAVVGLDVLGPALLAFGTDEQKRRHVAPDPLGR